ncbi:integral membrane family protein [[Clostridium] sordellii ATCC 9714]|nr:integral membrane family protein [[Clostridium] sordellii ATCC 9714] [Paeniclostridium sordellii ATCC 9714]
MNKYDFKKTLIVINCYHILIFVLNNIVGSNYAYMKSSPIGIGNNLNPYLYGIVVMSIFNVILIIEYIIMNRNKYDALEENYEFEILNT